MKIFSTFNNPLLYLHKSYSNPCSLYFNCRISSIWADIQMNSQKVHRDDVQSNGCYSSGFKRELISDGFN